MAFLPTQQLRARNTALRVVPLSPDLLPQLMRLQAVAYAGQPVLETEAFFANRLALAPQGCLAVVTDSYSWATGQAAGTLVGYLISHPWHDGLPPALGVALDTLPGHDACFWYLHDCAISPLWRGHGMAQRLLATAGRLGQTHGMRGLRLVSLGGAVRFWQRHGFVALGGDDVALPGAGPDAAGDGARQLRAKLADYGTGARFMQHLFS